MAYLVIDLSKATLSASKAMQEAEHYGLAANIAFALHHMHFVAQGKQWDSSKAQEKVRMLLWDAGTEKSKRSRYAKAAAQVAAKIKKHYPTHKWVEEARNNASATGAIDCIASFLSDMGCDKVYKVLTWGDTDNPLPLSKDAAKKALGDRKDGKKAEAPAKADSGDTVAEEAPALEIEDMEEVEAPANKVEAPATPEVEEVEVPAAPEAKAEAKALATLAEVLRAVATMGDTDLGLVVAAVYERRRVLAAAAPEAPEAPAKRRRKA